MVPVGLFLIVLSLVDICLTVLHVQAESPFSNRVQRAVWRTLDGTTQFAGTRARSYALAWGMPLMIIATIGFWVALHVTGYALVYAPYIRDPHAFALRGVESGSAPQVALYFSAVTFVTLGYGDVVPVHSAMRLLAVSEALFGLLTISFSVTYLLSVYPLVSRKVALAASLNQELAGRADGVAVAVRYVAGGHFPAFGERLRRLHDELLAIGQAHSIYPLLFYVRPVAVHESFVRVLALVQGLVCTLRYQLDPGAHADVVTDPRLAVLEESLLYTLHSLDRSSHLGDSTARVDVERILSETRASLAALVDNGLSVISLDEPQARDGLLRFRTATDPSIRSYAANLRYEPDAVRETFGRWARDTALDAAPADRDQSASVSSS
ncbi:MAG TPA: potassium channel family protein [Chloroflexota bacterium]|nr:potassium channel family protein [Chloroflexota bacterium]